MADGVKNKIGPFRYADGALGEKSFSGRRFSVVIAGAYDAGIIGSEDNGIAVLDEDFQNVVLSNHIQEVSGYNGPSARQRAEFDRIMGMDWKAFTAFVRSHPAYRQGSVPDIDEAKPRDMRPEPDRIIFTDKMKSPDCPYDFRLESRREITQFLLEHAVHRNSGPYDPFALAWNIKVHSVDTSGKTDGFKPDPQFDERWEEYLKSDEDLFWRLAGDELSQFTGDEYSTYDGGDEGKYKFSVAGRSGGWLVLTGVEGIPDPVFKDQVEMKGFLAALSDEDLIRLYKLVATVDKDVSDPSAKMAYQYSCLRSSMEKDWAAAANPSM